MAFRSALVALSLSIPLSIAGIGIAAAVFTTASVAQAQSAEDNANVEIMVLHATQQPGSGAIDPSIGNLPQLKKPPFSSFNTYKLLDRKSLAIKKGQPIEFALVDGRKLALVLVEKTPKPERYRLAASINAPKGEAFLKKIEVTASPNEPFFVAGQSHKGGILVLGIAIKEAK